ncbi:hypothetical protein IRL76_05170 [Qipengyuania soli]|uniref:DUF883 family protein n=2 Tax=Erythrobacteraceae TaxID=335929 RepID=A0A7S8F6K0_9SPHN|nr:hypothetical protein IRL76_05170 [Qipengyuania soli]
MADTPATGAPKKTKTTGTKKNTAKKSTTAKPRKPAASKGEAKETTPMTTDNRTEAKSRFNAALEEAKAGAAALKAEGRDRAVAYRDQAKGKSEDWVADAKAYGADAKVKGKELATEGKVKAGEGLRALSRVVNENAQEVDDRLGAKYGDYARSASRTLDGYAAKLDEKTVDDLVEDGREFVRKSPGTAIGIAAIAGFFLSRLFRRSR